MSLPGALVLLGHPVGHSLSPLLQSAALQSAGLPLRYDLRDVAPRDLGFVLEDLRTRRAAGNVTTPHKMAVRGRCATVTDEAAATGAVNAFRFDDAGNLRGHNTDIGGVTAAVRSLVGDSRGLHIGLLGAGGAARAVIEAAKHWDCWLNVWARRGEEADRLIDGYETFASRAPGRRFAVEAMDLVINATTLGMTDDALPAPVEFLSPGAAVLDLVYRRGETAWVRSARARGHAAADGRVMLLEQGVLAFEWWFGVQADRDAMANALSRALNP